MLREATIQGKLSQKKGISGVDASIGCSTGIPGKSTGTLGKGQGGGGQTNRTFNTMARVGRGRRVGVPPWVALVPAVTVGFQDIVKLLLGAERCTVPFWGGQLVNVEWRGRWVRAGRCK